MYPAEDYKNMKYTILAHEDKETFFKKYPSLKKYKEFKAHEKDIKYVTFVYDPNSPYFREFDDVIKRKTAVANELHYPANRETIDILHCRNDEINKLAMRVCRLIGGHELSTLAVLSDDYYRMLDLIQDTKIYDKEENPLVDAQKKEVIKKGLGDQLETIHEMKKKYFSGDNEVAELYFEEEEGLHEEMAYKYLTPERKQELMRG
jgi:hypothetical protein